VRVAVCVAVCAVCVRAMCVAVWFVCVCVCACVRACVCACVRAVRACVRAVRVCGCREQIAYAPRLGEALESGGTERRDDRVDTVQVAVLVGELMREGGRKRRVRHEHKLETSANGDDKEMMRDWVYVWWGGSQVVRARCR
jgi:hypothetical protein